MRQHGVVLTRPGRRSREAMRPASARLREVRGVLAGLLLLPLLWASGCDILRLVKDTSEGIKGTNSQLAAANDRLVESAGLLRDAGQSLRTVQPSLDRVAELDASMRKLAEMKGSMDRLADMRSQFESMQQAMDRMTAMQGTLDRMGALAPKLQAVADLREPMNQVAGLQPTLQAVADLKQPMSDLKKLGEPMDRVAQLHDPLTKTGELVGPMQQVAGQLGGASGLPGSVYWYAAGGGLAWMLTTALGVLLGVVVGNRLTRRAQRAA